MNTEFLIFTHLKNIYLVHQNSPPINQILSDNLPPIGQTAKDTLKSTRCTTNPFIWQFNIEKHTKDTKLTEDKQQFGKPSNEPVRKKKKSQRMNITNILQLLHYFGFAY